MSRDGPATRMSVPPGARGRLDANVVALLSLKLLLLGFFILLNALSRFEEDRARRVLESVNEAFDGRVEAIESIAPDSAALGSLEETIALIGAVGRLFEALIPAVRSEASAEGTWMRLELPANALFRPGGSDLQPGRDLLLRRLSGALTRDGRAGLGFQLELLHGVPEDFLQRPAADSAGALEQRRMTVLVGRMIEQQVPAEKLSIGLAPGRPGKVQLVIRADDAASGALDYRELAP